MKYAVNDNCIGCGNCADICPQVFVMTDLGVAQAVAPADSEAQRQSAERAMAACPVDAIQPAR